MLYLMADQRCSPVAKLFQPIDFIGEVTRADAESFAMPGRASGILNCAMTTQWRLAYITLRIDSK